MTPKILAVDFDGTLTKRNGFPHEMDFDYEMIDAFKLAKAAGHILVLNTCRVGSFLSEAVEALRSLELTFEFVNENVNKDFMNLPESRKVYADFTYDDTCYNWERDSALAHIRTITQQLQTKEQDNDRTV